MTVTALSLRAFHIYSRIRIYSRDWERGGAGAVAANKFIDRSDKIEATLDSGVSSAHSELFSRAASR